MQVVISNLHAK